MNTFFDIETIPGQGDLLEQFIEEQKENFTAPRDLTKTQAALDLGLTDANSIKFTSKDDMIARWERELAATMAPKVAEDKWRKTSFNAAQGEIITLGWAVEDKAVVSIQRDLNESEGDMLQNFYDSILFDLNGRAPLFIGHFVAGFDMRFLFQRSIILGVVPPFEINFQGRHGKDFFDNQIAWCGHKDRISQDKLAKALGFQGKPEAIDGSMVWDYVKEGRIDEVAAYNRDDVKQVREIFHKINFRPPTIKPVKQTKQPE